MNDSAPIAFPLHLLPHWLTALLTLGYVLYRINNAVVGRTYRPPEGSLLNIAGWFAGVVWRDVYGSVKTPLTPMPQETAVPAPSAAAAKTVVVSEVK